MTTGQEETDWQKDRKRKNDKMTGETERKQDRKRNDKRTGVWERQKLIEQEEMIAQSPFSQVRVLGYFWLTVNVLSV